MLFRITLTAVAIVVTCTATGQAQKTDPLRALSSERLQDDLQLTKRQRERVRELMLQWEGLKALRRADVAKEVGLRKSQQEEIEKIYDSHERLEFDYFKMRRVDRDKAKEIYREFKASAKSLDERVWEVLSAFQQKRFERMLGKPFDRDKLFEPKKAKPDV